MYKDDNRASFCCFVGPVGLYAWEIFDKKEFFQIVLVRLYISQTAMVDLIATTATVSQQQKRKTNQ